MNTLIIITSVALIAFLLRWAMKPETNLVVEVRFHEMFGWDWRIVAANNVELCRSHEAYTTKRNALKTARKIAGNRMKVEVV